MTIQELADRAEVTTRTIRYYVEQGVLPPPERGRPAEYTDEHIKRLALIKRLKEQYLPLEEIRDTMQRLDMDAVERLVEETSPPQQEVIQQQKPESAADYIAGVLGRGRVREQAKKAAPLQTVEDMPSYASVPMPGGRPIEPKSLREVSTSIEETRPQPAPASPVPPPSAGSASHSGRPPSGEAPTTWQRVSLGDGVELHVPAEGDAHLKHKVAQLIEAARRILGREQEDGPENGE
jgi:DNA-binding transcriptional MerR regulator